MSAAIKEQIAHLDLLIEQVRQQGDVQQVLLTVDGVSRTSSLADELGIIALNLAAALSAPVQTAEGCPAWCTGGHDPICTPVWGSCVLPAHHDGGHSQTTRSAAEELDGV